MQPWADFSSLPPCWFRRLPGAQLGREAPLAAPQGFVGRMAVSPDMARPARRYGSLRKGCRPRGISAGLAHRKGQWKVEGRISRPRVPPAAYEIATVRTDAAGQLAARFTAPEDFGFVARHRAAAGRAAVYSGRFSLDMAVTAVAGKRPTRDPDNGRGQGIGWRPLENSWTSALRQQFTGWIRPSRRRLGNIRDPSHRRPGPHVLEVLHGEFTFPYRNMQQDPKPTGRASRFTSR